MTGDPGVSGRMFLLQGELMNRVCDALSSAHAHRWRLHTYPNEPLSPAPPQSLGSGRLGKEGVF